MTKNNGIGSGARRDGAAGVAVMALTRAAPGGVLSVGPRLQARHGLGQIVARFAHLSQLSSQSGVLVDGVLLDRLERTVVVSVGHGLTPIWTCRATAVAAPCHRSAAGSAAAQPRETCRTPRRHLLLQGPARLARGGGEGIQRSGLVAGSSMLHRVNTG